MQNIQRIIAIFSLLIFVSACETYPIAGERSYEPEKGKSIILVGLISDERAILFNEENSNGPHWLRHLLRPEQQMRHQDVYAFLHPTGKSFKIVRVAIPGTPAFFREAHLTTAPSMMPEKDGIYYYGTMTIYGAVHIDDAEKAGLIKLAKEKYRKIFETLAPVNFR